VITGANVLGNGAFAKMIDHLVGRRVGIVQVTDMPAGKTAPESTL
jgi:hypothetical protein